MQFIKMTVHQKKFFVSVLFCAWGITFSSCSKLGPIAAIPVPVNRGLLFRLENVYQCEGYENREFNFGLHNISITRYNQTQYVVYGDMCAKLDIGGSWAGSGTLGYLETMDGTQPAELYKISTDSVCNDTMVKHKKELDEYSAYVENFVPKCPILQGCYRVNGMPFDTSKLSTVARPGYYFITILGTMDGDIVWCTTMVFKSEFNDEDDEDDDDDDDE